MRSVGRLLKVFWYPHRRFRYPSRHLRPFSNGAGTQSGHRPDFTVRPGWGWRTSSDLESLLEGAEFFRVNRSALVNLEAVKEMYPWLASGTWRVKLMNGVELDVSRERAKVLKERVGL